MSNTLEAIRSALQALQPTVLDIQDDSAAHAGHAGARSGGGHYQLKIVASCFNGLSRIQRHQLIYQHLNDLMQQKIHALAIEALTPEQQ